MKRSEFTVVGARFRPDGVVIVRGLKRGQRIKMRREPSNEYDKNAIQCLDDKDRFFGYVPRDVATHLAPVMDGGKHAVICQRSTLTAMGHCQITVTPTPLCLMCGGEGRLSIWSSETCLECDGTGQG